MKKILLFAIVAVMAFSLASCNKSGTKVKLDENITQSEFNVKQQRVIDSFGVSIENSAIVGYKIADEYLEYVVVEYQNGKKSSEATYRLYTDASYYKKALAEYGENPSIISNDYASYIKIASNNANTGVYKTDFEKLDTDYSLKTPSGVQ